MDFFSPPDEHVLWKLCPWCGNWSLPQAIARGLTWTAFMWFQSCSCTRQRAQRLFVSLQMELCAQGRMKAPLPHQDADRGQCMFIAEVTLRGGKQKQPGWNRHPLHRKVSHSCSQSCTPYCKRFWSSSFKSSALSLLLKHTWNTCTKYNLCQPTRKYCFVAQRPKRLSGKKCVLEQEGYHAVAVLQH